MKLQIVFLFLICASGIAIQADSGNIIYVNINAEGNNDGSCWDDAFTDLQDGLAAAVSGNDIWVAAGTYIPGLTRLDSFQMKNGVGIYGGFSGNETMRQQRNIQANTTILSGEIGRTDDLTDNCYHVFFHLMDTGLNSTAILDGFTITRGYAYYPVDDYDLISGGGMYNEKSSPTVRNCIFTENRAKYKGGAIYNYNSHPTVLGCTFINNSADFSGGGILNAAGYTTVSYCTFIGNWSRRGGGMANDYSSSSRITYCLFAGNTAAHNGGGMSNQSGNPIVSHCIFSGNTASLGGGGMYSVLCNLTLNHCSFSRNTAHTGGGMNNQFLGGYPCDMNISNCIFWGDRASVTSNEIYNRLDTISTYKPTFSYCNIAGCRGNDIWAVDWGIDGGGNMDIDPQFFNPNGQDGIVGTADDDLRLSAGSPCIDAGSNDLYVPDVQDMDNDGNTSEAEPLDLTGKSRYYNDPATADTGFSVLPFEMTVDIGAYEFYGPLTIKGDIDGDGDVDLSDLSRLAGNWLTGVNN